VPIRLRDRVRIVLSLTDFIAFTLNDRETVGAEMTARFGLVLKDKTAIRTRGYGNVGIRISDQTQVNGVPVASDTEQMRNEMTTAVEEAAFIGQLARSLLE
jgi:hypothetical protein